jgi:signal peptide peptidase SppA
LCCKIAAIQMTRKFLHLGDILSAKWLINKAFAEGHYPLVLNMLNQSALSIDEKQDFTPILSSFKSANPVYQISEFGEAAPPEDAPEGAIAIMEINGAITKYDQFCGNAGTITKGNLFDRAMANPNIKGLILSFDTGGGEGSATEAFAEKIRAATKPVVAIVNGMAASAGYWLASSAPHIIINGKTSAVGSIGVYISFADFSQYYEKMGIKVHTIYAPQSSEKNKAFENALNGDYEAMKADLEKFANFFIDTVLEYRPSISKKDPAIFQGAMYYAEEALAAGMADQIGNMQDAVDYINNQVDAANTSPSIFNSNSNMKIKIKSAYVALLSYLGWKAAEGADHAEGEISEAQLADINTKLGELETIKQELVSANTAKTTAEELLATANTNLSNANIAAADWKAKYEAMPGAVHTPIATTEDPNPAADAKYDWTKSGSKHANLAKAYLG